MYDWRPLGGVIVFIWVRLEEGMRMRLSFEEVRSRVTQRIISLLPVSTFADLGMSQVANFVSGRAFCFDLISLFIFSLSGIGKVRSRIPLSRRFVLAVIEALPSAHLSQVAPP
jgi:hypothetical protein